MTSEALRRHLTDRDLAALRDATSPAAATAAFFAAVDRLSDEERILDTAPSMRDAIARRASALWCGARPDRWTLGGMTAAHLGNVPSDPDGVLAAKALAVALRECAFDEILGRQEALLGPKRAALRNETDGREGWETALQPMLAVFAGNARACGASKTSSALAALAASAVLTGEASADDEDGMHALAAGQALASRFVRTEAPETPTARALADLQEAIAGMNDARSTLWDAADAETGRLMGSAAARAAFRKGNVEPPREIAQAPSMDGDEIVFADHAIARLPEAWRERLSHLTLASALEALEELSVDARSSSEHRTLAERLVRDLRGRDGAEERPFWEQLGYEPPELRNGDPMPGRRVRFAAPRGSAPARLTCRGARGRTIRCRAIADDEGAHVGYLAFDPLSREFGGRPLYAAYDRAGRRTGYAWADEAPFLRAGEPPQGFIAAPDAIPV